MLITLSTNSLRTQLTGSEPEIDLLDLPRMAKDDFGFSGLQLTTSLLKGWDAKQLEKLKDRADKAACPCLVLVEEQPHQLHDLEGDTTERVIDRMSRVMQVAHRLGCSSVAMSLAPAKGEDAEDLVAENLRDIVRAAERLEINLLLSLSDGMTHSPEALSGLIRKVGGFRIGSFPSFAQAAASGDAEAYLKAIVPYASAVCASCGNFDTKGKHSAFSIEKCVEAISAVGYDGSLAVESNSGPKALEQIAACKSAIESVLETEVEN
jgi:L-ribulose-5-phosphate 3-epimerase